LPWTVKRPWGKEHLCCGAHRIDPGTCVIVARW
jgi:hypothetical protein